MFEKNQNKNEPDALDERIQGLKNGLRASARLKAAAIDGEWIAPAVRTRTHVWRFTKAVAAYALGVMLLLGENGDALAEADQRLAQTVAGFLGKQMEN